MKLIAILTAGLLVAACDEAYAYSFDGGTSAAAEDITLAANVGGMCGVTT